MGYKDVPKFEDKELTLAMCQFLDNVLKKEEAEKKLSQSKNEVSKSSNDFLKKLMAPYFDFSKEGLVPTGNNNFIHYAKIEHNHKGLIISGNRCYFQAGKTIVGFHEEISVEDWLSLPEEIKTQNFEKLRNPGEIIKPTSIPHFYYNEADCIIDDENFQLVTAKERRISSETIPKQMFIICKNPEKPTPEHLQKILEVCEKLAIEHNPIRLNSSGKFQASQLLAENFRLSNSLFNENASFLVNIFGENAVERACSSLANSKEQKSKKIVVAKKKPTTTSNIDISKIKL